MTITPASVWSLDTRHLGQRVHVHDVLDSTNSLALSLAEDPTRHGHAILARQQSAGRGQYGRSWHAPPGSSVLLSLLLFPPVELRRPVLLTAWAAVSVCETIFKLAGLSASIKWPNDVLVCGKKVCGILIEQRTTGLAEFPLATVVGIGLNVTQSSAMFEQAGLPDAGSLSMLASAVLDSEDVARSLIHELDGQYAICLDGAWDMLEDQWKRRLGLLGEIVSVECVQQSHRGRLSSLTLEAIEIELDTGERLRLAPESVRQLRAEK